MPTTTVARPLLGLLLLVVVFIAALAATWEGRPNAAAEMVALAVTMALGVLVGVLLSRIPEPSSDDSLMHRFVPVSILVAVAAETVLQALAGPELQFTVVVAVAGVGVAFICARLIRNDS